MATWGGDVKSGVERKPLGYAAALHVLQCGRTAVFGGPDIDVPASHSAEVAADDLLPQFGYVGKSYLKTRVLVLSINPGNGPRDRRDAGDAKALPALSDFVRDRSPDSFAFAQQMYRQVCLGWSIWARHCRKLLSAGGLSPDDVAYSYCLPWRTRSEARFSRPVAENAVRMYAAPLIEELKPRVLVALGKRASEVLELGGVCHNGLVVWNRARALKPQVGDERDQAIAKLNHLLGQSGLK